MPAATDTDRARLDCCLCGQPFFVDCNVLRSATDAGLPPPTCGCDRVYTPPATGPRTAAETILAAMHAAPEARATGPGLHWGAIVERAWRADPGRFGLKGAAAPHPCSNRVKVELVKMAREQHGEPPVIESAGECLYRLTPRGQTRAARLANGGAK
jgi:hypothetical protein